MKPIVENKSENRDEPEAPLTAEDQARLDKIATIRAQLASGSYNISGKDVAEKILKVLKS